MTVLRKTVSLNPGESKPVTFKVTPTKAKTYQVSVDGLTGSFVALAPVEPFTYSNQQCSTIRCPAATAWGCPVYSCTITNPSSIRVTRTITFFLEDWSTYDKKWLRGYRESFQLTLDPGQSYNWAFDNVPPIGDAESKYSYGHDSIIYMHLEDDAGGASDKCATSY